MTILRVTTEWTGFQGAPGYTNFFFTTDPGGGDPQSAIDQTAEFWDTVKGLVPAAATFNVQAEVTAIDEATGQAEAFLPPVNDPPVIEATGQGSYTAPAGALIHWNTNGVRNGRRVRGRTFLVPMITSRADDDGTLDSQALNLLNAGIDVMVGDGFDSTFCVWARPGAAGAGQVWPVTSGHAPDRISVLRSRRD